MRTVADAMVVKKSMPRPMMTRTFWGIAAVSLAMAACSATGTEADTSSPQTTVTAGPTETTAPAVASTTTISTTTSDAPVATTPSTSSTSTTTTTEPPSEVNPPDVEAWWCNAFQTAAAQSPADFAEGLADDFRHGYSDVPADTLEEAAGQAALVLCDAEYGRAVADALNR